MSFQLCEKCCRTRSSSTQASKLLILGVHGGWGRRTETRRRCQRDLENHWHGIRGDDGVAHFDSSNGRWCSTAKVLQIPVLVVAGDRDSVKAQSAMHSSIRQSPGFSSRWRRFLYFKFLRHPSITASGMSFRMFWVGTLSFLSSSLTTTLVSEASFCASTRLNGHTSFARRALRSSISHGVAVRTTAFASLIVRWTMESSSQQTTFPKNPSPGSRA